MTPPDLVLERFCYGDAFTFGRMEVAGAVLFTVEKPWLENQPRISCIPEGRYRCVPRRYFRGKYDAVEITGVPDRSHILLHKANRAVDVQGCVGVGAALGCLGNDWAVLQSAPGFSHFMEHFGGREFDLEIRGPRPAVLAERKTA